MAKIAIDSAKQQLVILSPPQQVGIFAKHPQKLTGTKIRVEDETRFLVKELFKVARFELLADLAAPSALPNNKG